MPTTTSLLKSAAATRKKIQGQQDALVAFEWENSAQTYQDFQTYSKYLEDRQKEASDPSEALSYATKQRSARRSYTSNELQRQQLGIMEGRATTADKMAAVKDLYFQAIENGDLNLAQNLYSQWDALSIKLQNEQETAAKQFASASSAAKDNFKDSLIKGFDDVTLPSGQTVTPLAQIKRLFNETGDTVRTMQTADETLQALQGVIIDQYNNATTQDERDKLEQQFGPGLADLGEKLTLDVGGKKLTMQQVTNALANDQINNPIYGLETVRNDTTGQNEYKLKENNVSSYDFVRKIDEQGNEYFDAVEGADGVAKATAIRTDQNKLFFGTSDQGRGLDTQITDQGQVIGGNRGDKTGNINAGQGTVNRDDSQTIGNRLKELGYVVEQHGTTLKLKIPGENVLREATIEDNGSVRFFDDNGQLNEVSLVRKNLGTDALPAIVEPGQARVVSPDEISDFGSQSAFGGDLSKTSNQGRRYVQSITGQSRINGLVSGPISVGNNFSGYGGAVQAGNLQGTSRILQSAFTVRQQIQQEQARQLMLQAQAQALQATPNQFDLNQTPVQQLAANGVLKRQLSVAAPAPTPRVYVAPPAPTPRITSVGVAQPTSITSVGVATAPRVVVR